MKTKISLFLLTGLVTALSPGWSVQAQSTAFLYEGGLNVGDQPADGYYTFRYSLFSAPSGGTQVGPTITNPNVAVVDGAYATLLDFGSSVFTGSDLWLEIAAQPQDSTATFTALSPPRQLIASVPKALHATMAQTVAADAVSGAGLRSGSVTADKITSGQVVKSLNGLKDNIKIAPGRNVAVTASGNTLTIGARQDWSGPASFRGMNSTTGGVVSVLAANGITEAVKIIGAETSTTGGEIQLKNASNIQTVQIDGHATDGEGWFALYKGNGVRTIELDADEGGKGVITCQVLKITEAATCPSASTSLRRVLLSNWAW